MIKILNKLIRVFKIFNEKYTQVIKLIESIDSNFVLEILNLEEPAFWMYRAYKTINLIRDLKMKEASSKYEADVLIDSMLYLCEYITRYSYQSCLKDDDKEIEIREGGVIYVDVTGMISGYSKFIYDNKEIISDNKSALYLFRNICNLNKNLKIDLNQYRDTKEAINIKYIVSNPYFQKWKFKAKKEESVLFTLEQSDTWDDRKIYFNKWKKFKSFQVVLLFEPVYFAFFVKSQEKTQKKKMKGFRVKVNIKEWF